jgi:AcrR family transcriptional regulator
MDDLRVRMLEAAESLLNASPDRDISTRAVCDAVGVGAPTLYRQFGDKNGLLSAVVDYGFDRYLSMKRAAKPSADPVADLLSGWDSHVTFALAHPAVYRLMFSPSFEQVPKAAQEALGLLQDILERCAEAGRLQIAPASAAQTIMSASVGVALSLVTQPETYTDPEMPRRVRDAVFGALLVDPPTTDGDTSLATAAVQLATKLKTAPAGTLTAAETGLLKEWLDRLSR